MLALDDLVRAVRGELRRLGRLHDTVLVLAGDNGMHYGSHRVDRKRWPYETAVPFAVSWPAGPGTPGRTVRTLLSNIDFAPTVCDLVGCTLGPYPNGQESPDGRSFLGQLTGAEHGPLRPAMLQDHPVSGESVPAWFAIRTTRLSPFATRGCDGAGQGHCVWHFIQYASGERELYDTRGGPCWAWRPGRVGDPCHLHNLARRSWARPLVRGLRAEMVRLIGHDPYRARR
jgi:hypothetical protein